MSFYQNISGFLEYVYSIRKLETFISFDMLFPVEWGIPKSIMNENKIVPFDSKESKLKGISFVCEISESEIEENIGKIKKTIKVNKDKEQKELLFRETVEKLKKTFESNDIEKLKKISIVFMEIKKIEDESIKGSENLELVRE